MAESWAGQSLQALPATALGALGALGSEFLREWEAQDMRVTLFKLLLLWLVLSLLCVQLAWGFYGSTVTGLYHRPGEAPTALRALAALTPRGVRRRAPQSPRRLPWAPKEPYRNLTLSSDPRQHTSPRKKRQ